MSVDDSEAANLDEVRQAIEQLTTADALRLKKFAYWRMRSLGSVARGRDHEDLLAEAVAATLDSSRRTWRKGAVDFVRHLRMTMQSISDGWRDRKDFSQILEAELYPADPDEMVEDPLGAAVPTPATQEDELIAREALEALDQALAGDATAKDVLSGMRGDMTGPEIKEALGISETELQSARRKITRHAAALQTRFGPTAIPRKE